MVALSALANKLSCERWDNLSVSLFSVTRIIPVRKGEDGKGIRPIAIGDIFRRVVAKAIAWNTRTEVQEICSNQQLATGLKLTDIEAAISAVSKRMSSQAAMMVDASSTFNMVNRTKGFETVKRLIPNLYMAASSIYEQATQAFLGGKVISCEEGLQQVVPLAISLFCLFINPMVTKLQGLGTVQAWIAVDVLLVVLCLNYMCGGKT